MNTDLSGTTEPDTKRADELAAGDHVMEQPMYGADVQPMRVIAPQAYLDGDRRPSVALMLDCLDGGEPIYVTGPAERRYELATDEQIAGTESAIRRTALAKSMKAIAAAVTQMSLPVGGTPATLDLQVGSRDAVEAWAKFLHVEVVMSGEWPKAATELDGLDVRVYGPREEPKPAPEPQPDPEQEWLFTFGSGQQHDGRFVRITGTEVSARKEMNRIFGHAWCDQYSWQSFDAAGLPARMTELPQSEWPAHFPGRPTEAQALCIRRAAGEVPGEDVWASRPDVMERCELIGWIDREPGEDGRWYATPAGLAALSLLDVHAEAQPTDDEIADEIDRAFGDLTPDEANELAYDADCRAASQRAGE